MKLGSLLAIGLGTACASPTRTIKAPDGTEAIEVAAPQAPELEGESGGGAQSASSRKVGDLWVHRFSGNYRGSPVLLREEVIRDEAGLLTVHYRLEEGDAITELEVAMTKESERVISVTRINDGVETPGTKSDLESLMQKTTFIPDQNEGRVAQKYQTCLIGDEALDCEVSEYKVLVGQEEALLSVARNGLLKRDIGGEITAVDGTVIYHAELIEMKKGEDRTLDQDSVALVEADK